MMVLIKTTLREEGKALTDNISFLKGWITMSHAPNSPDLNPEDYNISLEMWLWLYQTKFHNAKELNQHMLDMEHGLKQSAICDASYTLTHCIAVFKSQQRRIKCS